MLTLESSNVKANALTPNTRTVQMVLVSNINVELKTINAIQQLDKSPLLRPILRPSDFPICRMNVHRMPFEYVGHVSEMTIQKPSSTLLTAIQFALQQEPLNGEQMKIVQQIYVRWAQNNRTLTLVDGPPGTGKSRLIANLLVHLIFGEKRPHRILLCAHSNAAVDVICRKLIKIKRKLEAAKRKQIPRNIHLSRLLIPVRQVRPSKWCVSVLRAACTRR